MPAAPLRTGFRTEKSDVLPPTYEHPPLVESWLAVDFVEGKERFQTDLTALRERLGPEWFGSWQLVEEDSKSDDRQLDNVMRDRAVRLTTRGFAFGWLGHLGERYPRYETIRDGFVATLDAMRDVAGREGNPLTARRWSVRYVNRIPQGTVWMSPGDWSFFRLWQPVPLNSVRIESGGYKGRWELPLERERDALTVKFRHTSGTPTGEIDDVWLTLQAKGPTEGTDSSLFDGLDYGREVIVRSFSELVSIEAKSFWDATRRPR